MILDINIKQFFRSSGVGYPKTQILTTKINKRKGRRLPNSVRRIGVDTMKKEKNMKRNGNVITRGAKSIKTWFGENLTEAKEKLVGKLIINTLFCVISAIAIFFLLAPAQELKSAYNEKNNAVEILTNYEVGSEEYLAQKAKVDEATEIYVKVKSDYKKNENPIISAYANNSTNDILVGVVSFILAVPFISIVIMLFKDIKMFLFAVMQIVIVAPVSFVTKIVKAIIGEVAAIHAEKKQNKRVAKHSENNVKPQLIDVVVR